MPSPDVHSVNASKKNLDLNHTMIPVYKTVLKTMRLPFLTLTLCCVLLGLANAMWVGQPLVFLDVALCFIGALAAHISVNTFNEAQDFSSGLDFVTVRTPFSGGSGGLVENPNAFNCVSLVAKLSLIFTCAVGLYFVTKYGLALLPLGLLGIMIVLTYTKYLNTRPILCLLAPGFGFGGVMVIGSSFVLIGNYSVSAICSGVVCLLLISNLLLLNQIPDVDADKTVGRKHFAIYYSVAHSLQVYLLFVLLAITLLVLAIHEHYLPRLTFIALLPMLLGFVCYRGLTRCNENNNAAPQSLVRYLGMNVLMANLTPLVMAICLIIDSTIHPA